MLSKGSDVIFDFFRCVSYVAFVEIKTIALGVASFLILLIIANMCDFQPLLLNRLLRIKSIVKVSNRPFAACDHMVKKKASKEPMNPRWESIFRFL